MDQLTTYHITGTCILCNQVRVKVQKIYNNYDLEKAMSRSGISRKSDIEPICQSCQAEVDQQQREEEERLEKEAQRAKVRKYHQHHITTQLFDSEEVIAYSYKNNTHTLLTQDEEFILKKTLELRHPKLIFKVLFNKQFNNDIVWNCINELELLGIIWLEQTTKLHIAIIKFNELLYPVFKMNKNDKIIEDKHEINPTDEPKPLDNSERLTLKSIQEKRGDNRNLSTSQLIKINHKLLNISSQYVEDSLLKSYKEELLHSLAKDLDCTISKNIYLPKKIPTA
jgi:hypothetical protein